MEFCREKSDGEVDSHVVGVIMTMLSGSYKKAVEIWKMQCLKKKKKMQRLKRHRMVKVFLLLLTTFPSYAYNTSMCYDPFLVPLDSEDEEVEEVST